MKKCKSILTPATKEPEICHALATTSAFNLKLCLKDLPRPEKDSKCNMFKMLN